MDNNCILFCISLMSSLATACPRYIVTTILYIVVGLYPWILHHYPSYYPWIIHGHKHGAVGEVFPASKVSRTIHGLSEIHMSFRFSNIPRIIHGYMHGAVGKVFPPSKVSLTIREYLDNPWTVLDSPWHDWTALKYPCLGRVTESIDCVYWSTAIFSPDNKQMIPEYGNACTTVWHIGKKLPYGGLVWLLLVRQSGSTV